MFFKILYSLIAFLLFLYIFLFKVIKKNDTMYVTILILQAIGILINFIQIIFGKLTNTFSYIIMYLLSAILPVIILLVDLKGRNFIETVYIVISKCLLFFGFNKKTKEILIKLISKYPNSYYGHKILAEIYEKEGGMRKAIDEYVKAMDIKPDDYKSYFRIAVLLNELKRTDESIKMLKTLIKKKPELSEASNLLGKLLIENEKYKDAINVYLDAIKHNSQDEELFYNLGIAYTFINDFSRAKQSYERATKINSDLYKAYYKLGQIALLYRDIETAETNFMQSIYDENEAKSYYQLAKIYVIKNDKIKATLYIKKAIDLDEAVYEKAKGEPILFPIRDQIKKPQSIDIYDKNKKSRTMQSKIEKQIEEYLDDTYLLTKEINNK